MLTSISSSSSSSSSKPAAEAEAVKDQAADSISNALRSFSIEDLSGQQNGGVIIQDITEDPDDVIDDDEEVSDDCKDSPRESDDLASESGSESGSDMGKTSPEDSGTEDDAHDGEDHDEVHEEEIHEEEMGSIESEKEDTEVLPPSGEMKSKKASKDEIGGANNIAKPTNQNAQKESESEKVNQTDQNQTSQNGSKTDAIAASGDQAASRDQVMDAVGFSGFSLADLTVIGEVERPVLLSEFQTSMYWLNQRLGIDYNLIF